MTTISTHEPKQPLTNVGPYQLFMLALCIWSLVVLVAGVFTRWNDSTGTILAYADMVVCGFFLMDFLKSLWEAPRKWHYLRTWGWIDLLSSIPVVDPLRWGRAARALRILRVLRGVKSARKMAHFLVERREQSAFFTSVLLTFLLLISGSMAILEFERDSGGNITTAEDAMWWAGSTMTTVGYGDRYPVTSEGRLIAVFLMTAGVGTFGVLAGLVASWFVSPATEEADQDRKEIKELLLELKAMKQARSAGIEPWHVPAGNAVDHGYPSMSNGSRLS
jgi:voltage-gated potassium channel